MADTPNETVNVEPSELRALRAQLETTEQELTNFKLQLADHINARKRLVRDAEVERKYATESLIRDLLPALDNLDRALGVAKTAGDSGALAAGVSATATQLLDILRRHGVSPIACGAGSVFDPNRHEAVSQQPSAELEPGQVIQVLQQGFMLHDRVLRPATVIVAAQS